MQQHSFDTGKIKAPMTPSVPLIGSSMFLVSFDPEGLLPNSVKVVFLFLDPYPRKGAACGVPVATLDGRVQPTLENFYKRLHETYKIPQYGPSYNDKDVRDKWEGSVLASSIEGFMPECLPMGDIRGWLAGQGVLFLNVAHTTLEGNTDRIKPHVEDWSLYTEAFIKWLSQTFPFLVFAFFGREAQEYAWYVSATKHTVIKTSHPADRGYGSGFGESDIFNEVNDALIRNLRDPIKWEKYSYDS
jgi:uracil DNA glycosylase